MTDYQLDPSTPHDHDFDEVEIEEADPGDALTAGMLVLTPCRHCGETPLEAFEHEVYRADTAEAALKAVRPDRPLYHWSPTRNRKQIIRYGLRPSMRRQVTAGDGTPGGWRAPYVCFADSPSWAWALSGMQNGAELGDWDLWQTYLNDLTDPIILPTDDRPTGMYEVRTAHRLYKRDLWYVATRTKTAN